MRRFHRQRGASLVDALVAFLVLSLGMLGIARLQTRLQVGAELARHHAQATRLAQRHIESFRATGSAPAIDASIDGGYRVTTRIAPDLAATFGTLSVAVAWTDRSGDPQRLLLESVMSGTPPALSAALSLPRAAPGWLDVQGRSASIPLGARNLEGGRSVFRPDGGSPFAFIFDNASGRIIARCTPADPPRDCTPMGAVLLSGWIRFADTPRPLAVSLHPDDGSTTSPPACFTETRDDALAYHCVVAPAAGGWSGRSSIEPQGWIIGTGRDAYQVCRLAADLYEHVNRNLMQQNFLIVRGDQACPSQPS